MIKVTVNVLDQEFHYDLNGPKTVGEIVGAAKTLHPNWSSMVVVLTRPAADAQTGPA